MTIENTKKEVFELTFETFEDIYQFIQKAKEIIDKNKGNEYDIAVIFKQEDIQTPDEVVYLIQDSLEFNVNLSAKMVAEQVLTLSSIPNTIVIIMYYKKDRELDE